MIHSNLREAINNNQLLWGKRDPKLNQETPNAKVSEKMPRACLDIVDLPLCLAAVHLVTI